VLLAAGALWSAVLPGGTQKPTALICVFSVLISALVGGAIAGWLALSITSIGLWFIAVQNSTVTSSSFQSGVVLWAAYVGLGMVLIEVIRHMQRERQSLVEQDQRLRLAGRAARIWFWEWDLRQNLLRWSRESQRDLGTDEYFEMSLERFVNRRVHVEDRERLLTAMFQSAASNQRFDLEYRVIEGDGSVHWLSAKGKIYGEDGSTMMLGMASEITAQKQAEEVRSHYRAVLGSLTEGVCYIDTSGSIQYMNLAAERLLGYESGDIRGKHLHDVLHVACASGERESCCLFHAMHARQPCCAQEEVFRTKAGEDLLVEYTAAPVSDGVTLGAVVMFRDISERKRAEEALRASEKMAATGRIAATISHELRNPLDSVLQLLYLVKQSSKLGDVERRQLELVDQELHRMTEVAQQTLAMHRQPRSMVPVNLAKLIDGVLLLYGKKIRSQNIHIEKRYEWQGEVPGFPAELRQVFTNLIVNAVDAMPSGGELLIHVRRYHEPVAGRDGVLIALIDTGTGISRNTRSHLFEPFFSTKGEKGSGVGLWVSSGIIQRHNGKIRVHSDDRKGRSYTCFEIFLPDAASQQLTAPPQTHTAPEIQHPEAA
jgi:PAS domain S-box-containing protein